MRVVVVIPARYASSRFPGKLLAKQTGKFLLQHVYEQACRAHLPSEVLVATDDQRIVEACGQFGAPVRMTRSDHICGTDRIAEIAPQLDGDIIVNLQGDEPEIDPNHLDRVGALLQADPQADLATLAGPFGPSDDPNDPNVVKVICDRQGHALYFSRWPIPYDREAGGAGPGELYRKHIGLYAYRREVLVQLSRCQPTPLEQAEKLEQLRALENGLVIAVADVEHPAVGIDTAEQYAEFVERYRRRRTIDDLQPRTCWRNDGSLP